jgi:hypothetical protein
MSFVCGDSENFTTGKNKCKTSVNVCICIMYVCMYLCMYVCMYACMHVCMRVCMNACMHVCMYACMYVCMHVCICNSFGDLSVVNRGLLTKTMTAAATTTNDQADSVIFIPPD